MQLGESSKNQVQMSAPYLLNHKTSWVLEEDMVPSYIKTFMLSISQKEVIKIEDLEDQQTS